MTPAVEPPDVQPEAAGFDRTRLTRAEAVVRDAAGRAFPGGVLVVGAADGVVLRASIGRMSYDKDASAVTSDTIYDLASLTKIVATTTVIMRLVDRGEMDLDAPLSTIVEEWQGTDRRTVRIRDALAHSTGLPGWAPLYERATGREAYVQAIARMPLSYMPGTQSVYSDLGFILLGIGLERTAGATLDALAARDVLGPLEMGMTRFNPPEAWLKQIAPTEADPWRGRLLRGEVHDENAFALGGVAAHAGLFGTAGDLARFCAFVIGDGVWNDRPMVTSRTLTRFTERSDEPGSSRALGWDTPAEGASCGRLFSARSVGHTGFTGTSIWIDLARRIYVILLTNRVHPSRANEQIRHVRPALHDAVINALSG